MTNTPALVPDVTSKSLAELISLAGKAAVVTGGAKGLGRAIVQRLAEAGASVLLADLDEATAEKAAGEIAQATGSKVVATRLDVTSTASVKAAADLAMTTFGAVDIWVNNAGIYPLTPVLDMPDEQWDAVLAVNLRGTFVGSREAARRMDQGGRGGVIVNIASTAGFKGAGPGVTHYVASKHGVRGITRQMALELAGRGIRVMAVAPATIVTEGVEAAMAGPAEEAGFQIDAFNTLLGRHGVPDDVARVVLFCASDLSNFMTGSTLLVDAGDMTR